MKIRPQDLSQRHAGMVCTFGYSTHGTGFIGHSHSRGLEEGGVSTRYVVLGRICEVTSEEIIFIESFLSKHVHDLSFSLGPCIGKWHDNYLHVIGRKHLSPRSWIYLNQTEKSNAVAQHLRANKSTFWNVDKRLLSHISEV